MSGLRVNGLEAGTGGLAILREVSFAAPAGAVTGLIGPNGAGKSTLIGALAGVRQVAAGEIGFGAENLRQLSAAHRARLVAHVDQSNVTTERLRVWDVVALGRIPFQSTWQAHPSPEDESVVAAALAELDVTGFSARLYHSLSGGEQQRVQLARALAQQPRLLLLDEPTSHLDIAAQLRVLALLRQRAAAGCTVLIALHDLNLAARFCDHLVVLSQGRVAAEGSPGSTLTAGLLHDVYRVHARVIDLPGLPHPFIVYDEAADAPLPTKSG